jgi:small GTP-binding protein
MKEIRIAVLGNVDSAKTTLVSTLTNKILDDGRGFARSKVFKHKHEQETGRTSSISFRYIKVNDEKYISFIDLAGHEKYFKTTVHGLNGGLADYAVLVIGSNMGVLKMTREHLGIIKALNIPFFIVLTKIDICPENVLERTKNEITRLINKNFKKQITEDITDTDKNKVKLFKLSNVTGNGLDTFREFLFLQEPSINWESKRQKDSIYWIDNVYLVKGIGIVISGTLKTGEIKLNDKMLLGPTEGKFIEVQVKSIHNNFREEISMITAGLSGCIAIKSVNRKEVINKKKIRKGMVLYQSLNLEKRTRAFSKFTASITILHHPTTIKKNYEPVIHCGKIAQTAVIDSIDNEYLRTGDKGIVKFRFKYRPEFIEKDDILIFREGKTKGIGKIIDIETDS